MKRPLIIISNNSQCSENVLCFSKMIAEAMDFELRICVAQQNENNSFSLDTINEYVEQNDVAMVVIDLEFKKKIQFYLNKMRTLRVPYIFVKPEDKISFENISVPVTYLEEDKEKAPFATSFARFLNSKLIVHSPNDYGTKAQKNIEAFVALFSKFNIKYSVEKSTKNSEKIELDTTKLATCNNVGMVIISASREYGLDDIILGPKEKKIISISKIPIMLINPRGDLYMLCD